MASRTLPSDARCEATHWKLQRQGLLSAHTGMQAHGMGGALCEHVGSDMLLQEVDRQPTVVRQFDSRFQIPPLIAIAVAYPFDLLFCELDNI